MWVRLLLGAVAVVLNTVVLGTAASAAGVIVSDDDTITVEVADDGTVTGSLPVINTSAAEMDVTTALAAARDGCVLVPEPQAVAPQRQQTVALTFTGCGFEPGQGIEVEVGLGDLDVTLTALLAHDDPDVDLSLLMSFVWSAVAALVLVLVTLFMWEHNNPAHTFTTPLTRLAVGWSLKDSWASNATAIATAAAGLFGVTEVTKSILGDEAESTIAIVLVASAVALVLVGSAPLLLQALVTNQGSVTPWGLAAAAILTLAGTGGELAVIVRAVEDTSLGEGRWLLVGGGLAAVLLAAYGMRSMYVTLVMGSTPPAEPVKAADPSEVSDSMKPVAEAVKAAADGGMSQQSILGTLYPQVSAYPRSTSRGDDNISAIM